MHLWIIKFKKIVELCADISHYRKRKRCGISKELSKRMSHRGPDESDLHVMENGSVLSHERLSIIDLHSGKQPIQGVVLPT
jgi:asparagine synthase (glutamine-hydrolysing)